MLRGNHKVGQVPQQKSRPWVRGSPNGFPLGGTQNEPRIPALHKEPYTS